MHAPPNRPAHLAKLLKGNPIYLWATGDSGQKLSEEEFHNNLPVPLVPFGVIAGDKGQKLTFLEPNDGVVTVQSTKLEGMADWVLLNHGHCYIMNCRDTFDYSLSFMETGRFQETPKDASINGGRLYPVGVFSAQIYGVRLEVVLCPIDLLEIFFIRKGPGADFHHGAFFECNTCVF